MTTEQPPLSGPSDSRRDLRNGVLGLFRLRERLAHMGGTPQPATRRRTAGEAIAFVVVVVVGVVLTQNGSTYQTQLGIDIAMFCTLAYSWNVISGFTGYISFGQVAFFGIGAFGAAELMLHAGVQWYLAAPAAGVISGLLAVPLGIVMLRLRGIYFALGMYGLVAVLMLVCSNWGFTGAGNGLVVPGINAQNSIFYYMVGTLVVAFALNAFMARSRFGLRAKAVRDDEEAASAMGVPAVRVKVTAYVLSAILPAVVGGLVAYNRSFIDSTSMFDPTIDLQTILFAIAGGMGTLWGPLIGTVVLELIGEQLWLNYPNAQLAIFGGLIILILLFMPGGVVSLFNRFGLLTRAIVKAPLRLTGLGELEERLLGRRDAAAPVTPLSEPAPPDTTPTELPTRNGHPDGHPDRGEEILTVRDVGVNFGGVQALHGVDLTVHRGETVCIIGANGAGKTTLFNATTGLVTPSTGTITFNGRDISGTATHSLAAGGLGRTFQIPRPFESMTVWENIYLAALGGRRRKEATDQAEWVVHILGLEKIWLDPVSTLPVGFRRMVELGRALALQPYLILLDEVMAGMSQEELELVRDAIRKMPDFGVGAVAGIEHVIRAIIDLADRVVVLDEGRKIAEGPPEEIMRHPEVIRAYLGNPDAGEMDSSVEVGTLQASAARAQEPREPDSQPAASGDQQAAAGVPALRLSHVTAGYGRLRVLEDISLEVPANEVISVIGANGAGKTTLLRAISGVIKPREGAIELFGEGIEGRKAHDLARAGIGHVPSGRELFAQLSVEDNLQLGAYGVSRERREALLADVLSLFPPLGRMLKRDAGALSGGQQQMLAVGRALMSGPRLLLLDEPSTGLAPKVVQTLFEAMRQLLEQGNMSILLVEQNVGLALSLAKRAYVLETGRIVIEGEAAELQQDERVVAAYLG